MHLELLHLETRVVASMNLSSIPAVPVLFLALWTCPKDFLCLVIVHFTETRSHQAVIVVP